MEPTTFSSNSLLSKVFFRCFMMAGRFLHQRVLPFQHGAIEGKTQTKAVKYYNLVLESYNLKSFEAMNLNLLKYRY
jgi:hypothetical protein